MTTTRQWVNIATVVERGKSWLMLSWLRGKHGYRHWLTLGASILLGLVFIISGTGKLLGESAFLLAVPAAQFISPSLAIIVNHWLPWVELVLGTCLIVGIATQLAALLSTGLVAAFVAYNSWMISQGLGSEPCGCFGIFDKILEKVFGSGFSTIDSLYIDIGLLILALVAYFGYQGKLFNVRPWFLRRGRVASGPLPVGEKDGSGAVPGNQG